MEKGKVVGLIHRILQHKYETCTFYHAQPESGCLSKENVTHPVFIGCVSLQDGERGGVLQCEVEVFAITDLYYIK